MTRTWTAAIAVLAFAVAFLVASVALGGEADSGQSDRAPHVRLSSVAALPTLAEDPAVARELVARARRAVRRERRLRARRAAARRATTVAELPAAAPAPEPVVPPVAVPAPAPAPTPAPPPVTFDDSG